MRGDYADLAPGLQVTLRNETGSVIGTGALRDGTWINYGIYPVDIPGACRMRFSIPDVPPSGSYAIQVGDRGAQIFRASDLKAKGYRIELFG